MFRLISVLLLISFCNGDNSEKQCSRYHYEEQILAKIVRMEHRLEQLEKMNIEKGTSSQAPSYKQCPNTWVSFNGSCYLFSEGKRTFTEAVLHCSLLNAHLVHVESQEENTFLKYQLNGLKARGHYWIGLTDIDREGTFTWYGTDKVALFTDWSGGGPHNSGWKENCVHFNDNEYMWNDIFCGNEHKSICEQKVM